MFAMGAVHAGIALLALVSMQVGNECANLGAAFFGPDFLKAYNTPTEREKKALEEQKQKEANDRQSVEHLVKAYSDANIKKGKDMDFTEIDKAVALTSDPVVVAWKYGMLMAAGKPREAEQIAARVKDMYTAFGTEGGGPTAEAKQLDATSHTTKSIYLKMDPNDPGRAAVKDDMCRQYRKFFSLDSGYHPDSIASIRSEAAQVGCA